MPAVAEEPQPKNWPKLILLLALKIAVTTACLYWAFSQIDSEGNAWDRLASAQNYPHWIALGIALGGLTILFSAISWHLLLQAQNLVIPFRETFRLTLFAALFNLVSFGSAAGDATKIIALIRKFPERKMAVSMSVMIDHLAGFVATAAMFLFFTWGPSGQKAMAGVDDPRPFYATTVFLLVSLAGLSLSFFIASEKGAPLAARLMPKLSQKPFILSMTGVYDLFRKRWQLGLGAIAVSILINAAYFLTFYAGVRSLGETVPVNSILSVMPMVDMVSALPISLSGLGVREKAFEFLISDLTSLPKPAAVSASLLGFLYHSAWGIIGGIAFLIWKKPATEKP